MRENSSIDNSKLIFPLLKFISQNLLYILKVINKGKIIILVIFLNIFIKYRYNLSRYIYI